MAVRLWVHIGPAASSPIQNPTAAGQVLLDAVEGSLPPDEIAEVIGMPPGTLVKYELSNDDIISDGGVVRVRLHIHATNDSDSLLSSSLEAEVGDLVLQRLDGLAVPTLRDHTSEVTPDSPAELRFEVADSLPRIVSSDDLAAKAGFVPGEILGWSKGCNSWPW
jgi:hypothetical protein